MKPTNLSWTKPVTDLFDYQDAGADYLARSLSAYLGDQPGLGKTAQIITGADRCDADRILIVPPASLKVNWAREFAKWSDRGLPIHIPTSKERLPLGPGVTILNYELVTRPHIHKQIVDTYYDVIAFDEAHYLKSPGSQRSRAILGDIGIIMNGWRTWFASGTPAPNHIGELYPILAACFPKAVRGSTYEEFLDYYCITVPTNYGPRVVANKPTVKELKRLLRGFMLRRLRKDVLPDLPELVIGSVVLENDKAAEAVKDFISHHPDIEKVLAYLGDETATEDALEAVDDEHMATLRKLCGIAKAPAVADEVNMELDGGTEQIVLMCWHHEVIDFLKEKLARHGVAVVDGRVPKEKRQQQVDKFNGHSYTTKCRVFIGQIQAAGVGHTLTNAHDMIVVEPSWVPGENFQAILRIHRIGQENKCLARFAKLAGSIDEAIVGSAERKARLLAEVL